MFAFLCYIFTWTAEEHLFLTSYKNMTAHMCLLFGRGDINWHEKGITEGLMEKCPQH